MSITRRDLLKGTAATAVVATVPMPSREIAGLTPAKTLTQLAAEGKYASSDHHLPADQMGCDFEWFLDGVRQGESEHFFVREIYAPGDQNGWAVLYVKQPGAERSEERVVHGNWTFTKTPSSARV